VSKIKPNPYWNWFAASLYRMLKYKRKAKFTGKCICGKRIVKNKSTIVLWAGAWVHEDCAILEFKKEIEEWEERIKRQAVEDYLFENEFWEEKVRMKEAGDLAGDDPVARIDGNHYIVGKEDPNLLNDQKGFGGRRFVIRWKSGPHRGKVIETTNLWHQGRIPERFRDKLPDNAEFVEGGFKWVEKVEGGRRYKVPVSLEYLETSPQGDRNGKESVS